MSDKITLAVICFAILFLLTYPIMTMLFLIHNQGKLNKPEFKRKFNTLYDGLNTYSKIVLLYDSIFSMRRFFLVLVNVMLNSSFPLTPFDKNEYMFKILIFLFM